MTHDPHHYETFLGPPALEELPQRHSLAFWRGVRTAIIMVLAAFVLCILLPAAIYLL